MSQQEKRFRTAAFVVSALLVPCALAATEFGATHLVFEKATKMKKVSASLYMSYLDQSARNDGPDAGRSLRCAVAASGKAGVLEPKGKIIVRLAGRETGSNKTWLGSAIEEVVDDRGRALFEAAAILPLAAEAAGEGAEPDLFLIDFDGGKGKKASQVTVDCIRELTE